MTNDLSVSAGDPEISDPIFFGVLALSLLLIAAAAMYLLGHGWSTTTAPLAATVAPQQSPGRSSSVAKPTDPTRAGALAVVAKSFQLAAAGRYAAYCALESPAYLRYDAQHDSHGSCEAELRADSATLTEQGLSIQLASSKVESFADGKATILTTATVGARAVTEHIYLRYHAGSWWMTGADDSHGDLGF